MDGMVGMFAANLVLGVLKFGDIFSNHDQKSRISADHDPSRGLSLHLQSSLEKHVLLLFKVMHTNTLYHCIL